MSTLTIAGNLPADPELNFTSSGAAVAKFTVLENTSKRRPDGSYVDGEPNSVRVEVWNSQAENLAESVGRGDRVVVTGRLVTDKYPDKTTGEMKYRQYLKADEVGVSMRFHVARAVKSTRKAENDDNDQ